MRIGYDELKSEFKRVLISRGVDEEQAEISSTIFANNDLDGIHTHGSIRFPNFIKQIEKKEVNINGDIEKISGYGGYEVWDGNRGIGNVIALKAMDRAMKLSDEYGIGLVALKNTSHWMRGGTYGWHAAEEGYVSISWTNCWAGMPAWGGKDNKLGNNPIVIGVPRENEKHIVLDTSFTQFSYGKLEEYSLNKQELPVYGGYDENGELTKNPDEILKTENALPIGYWKGSGLSLLLDLVAVSLTGGNSVAKIYNELGGNFDVIQIFIAINPSKNLDMEMIDSLINYSISDLKSSELVDENKGIRYPGERAYKIREENLLNGILIHDEVWKKIKNL